MGRGRRLLPGSLRFRLTAWYALILAGVLAALGFLLMGLVGDRLRSEADARLARTAVDLAEGFKGKAKESAERFGRQPDLDELQVNLGPFASRGLLIQVVQSADGREWVAKRSEYATFSYPLMKGSPNESTGKAYIGTTNVSGENHRVLRLPFSINYADRQVTGAVIVSESMSILEDTIDALRYTLIITSVAGLALAILGGWLLADRALRPVDRITAAAATIADGDGTASSLGTRLDVPDTGDELARLSGTFNAMLDRLQAAFVAQQRFVADASHELRTPLTAIRGNLDVLARQVAALRAANGLGSDLDAAVADMKRESARMGRLLEDLLLLARSDAPEGVSLNARPVRLDAVARDAVRTAAPLAAGQVIEVDAPEAVTVSGDPDRLLQLLLILLENALRHSPAGSRVVVGVAPPADGEVRVAVRDEGEGIAPEHLPHLFERFYRADGARGRATGGTGLGLAIADTIVRAHGGRIGVESAPGQGSTFTVTLPTDPASRAEQAVAGPIVQPARPPGAPLTQSSPRSPAP